MKFEKEGQVSIEYMFIIGFVTLITVPLVMIYYTFTQQSQDEITSAQVMQVAKNVIDASESVYYLGEPSRTTLKVNIPKNVIEVNLSSGYEVVFKIMTRLGPAEIVQDSPVNITGSLPTSWGTYTVIVIAKSDHVEVSYK